MNAPGFVSAQTFDFSDRREEVLVLTSALDLIQARQYAQASRVLIARLDKLEEQPKLKPYDQREVHV